MVSFKGEKLILEKIIVWFEFLDLGDSAQLYSRVNQQFKGKSNCNMQGRNYIIALDYSQGSRSKKRRATAMHKARLVDDSIS